MATERERGRCRERLERLDESTLDCDSLRYEAVALLRRTVGFDRWCWPLADPDTLIPLSGVALAAVPVERSGVASGVFNTARESGGALGIATIGAIVATDPRLAAEVSVDRAAQSPI